MQEARRGSVGAEVILIVADHHRSSRHQVPATREPEATSQCRWSLRPDHGQNAADDDLSDPTTLVPFALGRFTVSRQFRTFSSRRISGPGAPFIAGVPAQM